MAKQKDLGTSFLHALFGYLLLIALLAGAIAFLTKDLTAEEIRSALNGAGTDTTITIHNGVPDTVITIRK